MLTLKTRIRLTIGAKLVGLIGILLLGSIISLVWLSTRMFTADNTALIQQMNADMAANLATQARELFTSVTDKTRMLGTVLLQNPIQKAVTQEFFDNDKDLLGTILYQHKDGAITAIERAISPELGALGDADAQKTTAALLSENRFSLEQVAKGEIQISTVKLPDGSAAIAVGVPFIKASDGILFSHTLVSFIKQSRFLKTFSASDIVTSFMVDRKGKLLAHPDASRVAAGENVAYLSIVKQMLEGKFNNGETRYTDPHTNEPRLGAFHTIGFAGLGVITEVPEAKAFEAARRVEYRSMLIACIILCISFFTGYLYSGTITWPIKQLVGVARQISEGDFRVNLKTKSHDEVAQLALAFNDMAKGLEERDRVKDTFNKFHNKEIAEKILSGEVKLGGERREATIFFSDVRGFTAMSESMEPEQVVELLNEYMTRMVSIIRAHGGVVDKYVGDAIMALWGVPITGPDDTAQAIRASIEMRKSLAELNELRLSRGQSPLIIGMGINTGPVIAGNIGSTEKMEYTVIGDSVNLASRIESMTKEYGTDLLVSNNVYQKIKDQFLFEKCKSAQVKGKAFAVDVYKVTGYIENGEAKTVETAYSSYDSELSDKVVHLPSAERVNDLEKAHPMIATSAAEISTHNIFADRTDLLKRPEPIEWFFKIQEELFGPFTRTEILDGLRSHELSLEMEVSPSPEGPWKKVADTEEFKTLVESIQDRTLKAA